MDIDIRTNPDIENLFGEALREALRLKGGFQGEVAEQGTGIVKLVPFLPWEEMDIDPEEVFHEALDLLKEAGDWARGARW